MSQHNRGFEARIEHSQAFEVQMYARVEEPRFGAVEHHTHVDKLSSLHPWHHPQQGVLKQAAHEPPSIPAPRLSVPLDESTGNRRRRHAPLQEPESRTHPGANRLELVLESHVRPRV